MPQDIAWGEFPTEQFKAYVEWKKEGEQKKFATCFCFLLPTLFHLQLSIDKIQWMTVPVPR